MIVISMSFRIFVVISVTMSAVGKAIALISDYAKAKAAALRILWLQQRISEIDPHDQSGITLVRAHLTDHSKTLGLCRMKSKVASSFSMFAFAIQHARQWLFCATAPSDVLSMAPRHWSVHRDVASRRASPSCNASTILGMAKSSSTDTTSKCSTSSGSDQSSG